jgi:hypothetical protein
MHASRTSSSLTKTYSTNAVEDKETKMPTNKMLYINQVLKLLSAQEHNIESAL